MGLWSLKSILDGRENKRERVMNKYYIIYRDKESGGVTRANAVRLKMERPEVLEAISKQNSSQILKETATLSEDPLVNEIIDLKGLSKERLLSELKDIQEEIRNLEYSLSTKVDEIRKADEQ